MGFLDKAKEAAEKAMAAGQQAAQQGQAKIGEMKSERAEAALVKTLGEAVYAEQRHNGSHDAVEAALSALDAHHAEVAAAEAAAAAGAPAASTAAPSAPSGTPAGDFTLEDM